MRATLIGLGLLAVLAACDEEKKKDELVSKTADAAPAPVAASAPLRGPDPSAVASASAAPAVPAKPKECAPGPNVVTDDSELEEQLRLKSGKLTAPSGGDPAAKSAPPSPVKVSDLANVKSLDVSKKASLDELDPCIFPKLVNLKHLYLGPGKLRDLKPIAGLVQLESLRASINEVEDLKPLEKLEKLDRLDLGRTHVRDITPVGKLVNLTELALDDTQVTDISPLAACKKLEKLSIKRTNVADVSSLRGLTKLKFLYVGGSAVTNLDSLSNLTARGLKIDSK